MLSKFIFSISEAASFMLINQMAVLLCKAGVLPSTPPQLYKLLQTQHVPVGLSLESR